MNLWTIGARWGRLAAICAVVQSDVFCATTTSLPIVHQKVQAPQANLTNAKLSVDIARFKQLVKLGEKALEAKNSGAVFSFAGQAEALFTGLPPSVQKTLDVSNTKARLKNLQHYLNNKRASLLLDSGFNGVVKPLSPSLEYLHKDTELIKSINQVSNNVGSGPVYDFPIDLNDKVVSWIHQFTTSKRHFMEQTLSRASQYLPMVHQIFAEEHVPKDLAYLAVIESGFMNSASSCAKAVGMWQFMQATGRNYGLSGNKWVEERRDPVKATRAAARYLRQLYKISGDWYLALVGYNAGPRAAERAISNLKTRNFWDMHRSRWLRNQTKDYVPELCAAILIGRFPEQYGLKIEQLAPYTYDTIEVDRMTSLPVLARYANIDLENLKRLNPELLRNTTPPGRYALRVPPGMGQATAQILTQIPDNQRSNFIFYSVKKRDTLAQVATKFGISVDDLLKINNISKSEFRSGSVIQVPPALHVAPVVDAKREGPNKARRVTLVKNQVPAKHKLTERNASKRASASLHLVKDKTLKPRIIITAINKAAAPKQTKHKIHTDQTKV